MTATKEPSNRVQSRPDKAQYVVCVVLVAVGAFLIGDALGLTPGYTKTDPLGPRVFPIVIGCGAIVSAILLAIAIPRGSRGAMETGEDIDPSTPADWRTVVSLVGLFAAAVALVMPLGWAIVGALLFAGAATLLGSKRYVLNLLIGIVLSVGSFYAFYSGLGIPLPAGILKGIL